MPGRHSFHPGIIGKSILCKSSDMIGSNKEPTKIMVYKKGRNLPPHAPHHPPVVGSGGRARIFVSVQRGGPDRLPIQPHKAPCSTLAVGKQNDPPIGEFGGIYVLNQKTLKKELVSTGQPRKSRRIRRIR